MEVFQEWLGEFERGKHGEDKELSQNFEGKLKKVLKTDLLCKTRDFRDWFKLRASRQGKSRDSLKPKFLKIFLSVFQDWKFYLRGSREVSHENFCVPLATRPSTHEQVTRLSRKKH